MGAGQHAQAGDGLRAVNLTGDQWIAKRQQENESQELSDLARQGIIRHNPPNDKEVLSMTLPVQIRLLSTALIFLGTKVDAFAEIKIRELGL